MSNPTAIKAENDPIWAALRAVTFDDAQSSFAFTKRLARDNGWSHAYAQRVTEEYRKFAYLCVAAGREMTPSDEVDQAWHLHLTYTEHYWGTFTKALGAPLHHNPTAGGPVEAKRYHNNYDATLAAYETFFGRRPPRDIWPSAKERFGNAPYMRRVNRRSHFVIPKAKALPAIAASVGAGVLYASVAAQEGGQSGRQFFDQLLNNPKALGVTAFAIVVVVALTVITKIQSAKAKGKEAGAGGAGCSAGGGAGKSGNGDGGDGGSGCGGGCGGCGG